MTIEDERLLNVAKACRESTLPDDDFDMETFAHTCGTPACAFGLYAARTDLQDQFRLGGPGPRVTLQSKDDEVPAGWSSIYQSDPPAQEHFGIDEAESEKLFGPPAAVDCDCGYNGFDEHRLSEHDSGCAYRGGCDGARTALEAAQFIEKFVAERQKTRDK